MKPSISLLIVDDHPVVAAGIGSLLLGIENVKVAGHCTDGQATRDFLAQNSSAIDIIVLDINLPDISGIDLCLELKKTYPHLRILALSNYNERSMISKMIENGASGYLLKNATILELQHAIEEVTSNKLYFSNDVVKKMLEPVPVMPQLTRREKEILKLIAEDYSSSAIAASLFISQYTVETHRRHIVQKFNASSMAAVVKMALDYNII